MDGCLHLPCRRRELLAGLWGPRGRLRNRVREHTSREDIPSKGAWLTGAGGADVPRWSWLSRRARGPAGPGGPGGPSLALEPFELGLEVVDL